MRRAGTVVSAPQGMAVVRCPDEWHPSIGTPLLDERLDRVGRVVDVIGSVGQPFVVVSPAGERDPASLLGVVLYTRAQ